MRAASGVNLNSPTAAPCRRSPPGEGEEAAGTLLVFLRLLRRRSALFLRPIQLRKMGGPEISQNYKRSLKLVITNVLDGFRLVL